MVRPLSLIAAALIGCSDYDLTNLEDGVEGAEEPGGDQIPSNEATGSLHGRICGPDGENWVVGAEVSVEHPWGTAVALTDDEGWFLLEGVPVGAYTVLVEKGSFTTTFDAQIVADQVTELPVEECLLQNDVSIAVVEGTFDSIELVLDHLSLSYDYVPFYDTTAFLMDPARLAAYDIIFFNCGMDDSWSDPYWGGSPTVVGDNLRTYVNNGGSVYASDWAYWLVETAWPQMNTFQGGDSFNGQAWVGDPGTVTATVLDPVMASRLGSSTAMLNYDLLDWVAIRDTQGEVLIEGTYSMYGQTAMGPLAVRMDSGNGRVLYTTFHNETQTTLDMDLLLQEIILSL